MVNHVVFQGRFVDDPKCGQTNSGTDYANFRIAWSEKYKEKETRCFLECKAFGGTAQFIGKYFTKGKEILVEGKLNTDEWQDQEGNKRSKIVLMVNGCHFCGKADGQAPAQSPAAEPEVPVNMTPVETDELPF